MTRRVLARRHHACRDSGRKHEGHFSRFFGGASEVDRGEHRSSCGGFGMIRAFRACSPMLSQLASLVKLRLAGAINDGCILDLV